MEAIRSYLESMFTNLPNTPEVLKAKYELGQMMEDKYTELINQGKTKNEAIGTVIAEFGNLEELAEDLGIRGFVNREQNFENPRRSISLQEAQEYIKASSVRAVQVALGIMFCILAPAVTCILGETFDGLATGGFFLLVAIGVALFVYSGVSFSKWEFVQKMPCTIELGTAQYVQNQKDNYKSSYALCLTVGIVLCAFCVMPAIVIDGLYRGYNPILDEMSGTLTLAFVAVGVFMIVLSSMKNKAYTILLDVNDRHTVSGGYVNYENRATHYESTTVEAIMSVYWPTITCIYLIWSFVTLSWWISWIIWPVAGVIHTLIKNLYGKK